MRFTQEQEVRGRAHFVASRPQKQSTSGFNLDPEVEGVGVSNDAETEGIHEFPVHEQDLGEGNSMTPKGQMVLALPLCVVRL